VTIFQIFQQSKQFEKLSTSKISLGSASMVKREILV